MAVMESEWRQDACLQAEPSLGWRAGGIAVRIGWTVVILSGRVGSFASRLLFGRAFSRSASTPSAVGSVREEDGCVVCDAMMGIMCVRPGVYCNKTGRQWKARLSRGTINCSFEENSELQSKIQSMEMV